MRSAAAHYLYKPVSRYRSCSPLRMENDGQQQNKKAVSTIRPVAVARPMTTRQSSAVVGVVEPRVVVKIPWSKEESMSMPATTMTTNQDETKSKSISGEMTGRDKAKRKRSRDLATTAESKKKRKKTRRSSESSKLNPGCSRIEEDDGTPRGGSSRKRKIPEINFEMEKGEEATAEEQQQRRSSRRAGRLAPPQQQEQFSITETLPEHFREALMKSLFLSTKTSAAAAALEKSAVAAFEKRGFNSSSLPNEANNKGLLQSPISANCRLVADDGDDSRINPLKLIRRFVPGTNQEEYKVEDRRRRRKMRKQQQPLVEMAAERIVVDLASEDEDGSGGKGNGGKSISEAYLRARMPLINVSLVAKKKEEEEEEKGGNQMRPLSVCLERLSGEQIERHLNREEKDDYDDEIFGHKIADEMKSFKELLCSSQTFDATPAVVLRIARKPFARRNSFQSYRNDVKNDSNANRMSDLVTLAQPAKSRRVDCENVHKEGRVDSLADGVEQMRLGDVDAVSTLSDKKERQGENPISECGDSSNCQLVTPRATSSAETAAGSSQREIEEEKEKQETITEETTATTSTETAVADDDDDDDEEDNDHFLEDDVRSGSGAAGLVNEEPFPELDSVSSIPSTSMPIIFSDQSAEEDFSNLLTFETLDMRAIGIAAAEDRPDQRAGANLNEAVGKAISGGGNGEEAAAIAAAAAAAAAAAKESSDGEEIVCLTPRPPSSNAVRKQPEAGSDRGNAGSSLLDDLLVVDNEELILTPGKTIGRPRKYRKTMEQIEEEADNRTRENTNPLPVIDPSRSSGLNKAEITFEKERPGEDKWMYCRRSECNFWTRKPHRMERHRLCHPSNGTRFYVCPDCDMTFVNLSKFLRHDRKEHTGEKDYECKICEAEVTDITVHMRVSYLNYIAP
jgi:hypothetical protein